MGKKTVKRIDIGARIALPLRMATGDDELEQFKTQINLCEYAASIGFETDRKQSSKRNAVMRNSQGDKIAIVRRSTGHWVYINTHGQDSGSIIDFVQAQKSLSIGQVRKELRPWISGKVSSRISFTDEREEFKILPIDRDLSKVNEHWRQTRSLQADDQYLPKRGISNAVLEDPIFADRIRVDHRSNMIFPHWNVRGEFCGFEIKNQGFTGFSPSGEKGLWCSRPQPNDQIMVISESAIDALSMATLFGISNKRFFSTGGQCSLQQLACLKSAINNMPIPPVIWLAMDNDDGGKRLVDGIRAGLESVSTSFHQMVDKRPEIQGSDWNDILRNQQQKQLAISRHCC